MKQSRLPEAEALFRRALGIARGDIDSMRELGAVLEAEDQNDKAIDAYESVRMRSPRDRITLVELTILYEKAGRFQESLGAARGIPAAEIPPSILPVLAADYFGLKQPESVQPLIPRVVRSPGRDCSVAISFARTLRENGFVADAARLLETVRPAKPPADLLGELARIRQIQGKNDIAIQLYEEALRIDPKSFDLLYDFARFYADQNDWPHVIHYLGLANDLYPDRPEILKKLVLSLLKIGRIEGAVAVAQRLNQLSPDDPDVQHMLAMSLSMENHWEAAEPIAVKLAATRPNDASAQLLLGSILLQRGKTAEAKSALEKALALDPNTAEAHFYLGQIAETGGDVKLAKSEFQKFVSDKPDEAGGHFELGKLEMQDGDLTSARKDLEAAVRLGSKFSQNYYQLGMLYTRLGMKEEASKEMKLYEDRKKQEDDLRRVNLDKYVDPVKKGPAR